MSSHFYLHIAQPKGHLHNKIHSTPPQLAPMLGRAAQVFVRRSMATAATKAPSLQGRVAVVTASTDGIGLAIARRLARDGAQVMVSSRREDHVKHAVEALKGEGLSVEGTICHVGKEEHRKQLIQETVKAFGRLDILVSNAAVNPTYGPVLEADSSVWDKVWDINVKSAVLLVKEAYPHLKESSNASIILVSSIAGYQPMPFLGVYSISKTALIGATKVLSSELVQDGIRVNCLAPGLIKTKFSSALWTNKTALQQMEAIIGMKRLGTPDECAGMVAFLASDDSKYVTGETFVVAGGMLSRL